MHTAAHLWAPQLRRAELIFRPHLLHWYFVIKTLSRVCMHAKLVLAHKLDHKLVVNRSLRGGTRAAIVSVLSLVVLKTTRFLFDRSVCHVFFSILEEEGLRCFLGISKEATEEAVSRLVEEGTFMVAFRWEATSALSAKSIKCQKK